MPENDERDPVIGNERRIDPPLYWLLAGSDPALDHRRGGQRRVDVAEEVV